jgi:hypothetical protein
MLMRTSCDSSDRVKFFTWLWNCFWSMRAFWPWAGRTGLGMRMGTGELYLVCMSYECGVRVVWDRHDEDSDVDDLVVCAG